MSQTIELMTYADAIDHLVDWGRSNPSDHAYRDARRAVLAAYRDLRNDHPWTYYFAQGRICLSAPYDTGTVEFDYTGGGAERLLTLTGGTWPTWAAFGVIIINAVQYEVADRLSDNTLQLDINLSPTADISSGTSYTLMRDTYVLPSDLVSIDQMYSPENWRRTKFIHPREWLVAHRYNETSSNVPFYYTITGDPNYMGSLSARVYPYPDSETNLDYIYQRRGRPLRVERVSAGKVSVSNGSAIVNSDGDSKWTSDLVGSTFRSSFDANLPTGREGENPYEAERTVMSVQNNNQLTLDQQVYDTRSGVAYVISDPVDLEPGVMTTSFLRRMELEYGKLRRMPDRGDLMAIYRDALDRAKAHDSRSTAPRTVGGDDFYNRLAYHPSGDDVE